MSLTRSRVTRAGRRATTGTRRALRAAAALVATLGLLLVAGCGMHVQTNNPYTPAEGINIDVGDRANPNTVVHVRNLLIIVKGPGQGVLSASIVTGGRDQLVKISGNPIKQDDSAGQPFTVTVPNTVSVANGSQVVLTDQPLIVMTSADIVSGRTANITLEFQNAGQVTLIIPMMDGSEPQYASISPTPVPSPTPSASPSS